MFALVLANVIALGCSRSVASVEDAAKPAVDPALRSIPARDLVGYASGNYGTSHNHPAMYADLERKVFVLMGQRGTAEIPLDEPDRATRAYVEFLLLHGYPANGKTPPETHPKIVIDGKELVVVAPEELFPQTGSATKARFTPSQRATLDHTSGTDIFPLVGEKWPIVFAYGSTVVVVGPKQRQKFPIANADDALAAYRALL